MVDNGFILGSAAMCLPNPSLFTTGFSIIFLLLPQFQTINSISFNFPSFRTGGGDNITYLLDAFVVNGAIELTRNRANGTSTDSAGRVFYNQPVQLWDPDTRRLTDFATHFSFKIEVGDGFGFFLAANGSDVPRFSGGGFLALFPPNSFANNITNVSNPTVAVEFDTFQNSWDSSSSHVGIDINSIVSVETQNLSSAIKNVSAADAWVSYNATTMFLSVFLNYHNNALNFTGTSGLSYPVDLREVLPPLVYVGFSATTGSAAEFHNIISWNFTSNLNIAPPAGPALPAPRPPPVVYNAGPTISRGAVVGVVIGSVVGLLVLFALLVVKMRRRINKFFPN